MKSNTNEFTGAQIDYGVIYRPSRDVLVVKKDGTKEPFNVQKVITAVQKSAYRALTKFTEAEKKEICRVVVERIDSMDTGEVPIAVMHNTVEATLERIRPEVAKAYKDYRNYKQDFVRMMDDVYQKSQSIMYIGDKENSNTDSALVATKRSLTLNQLNKELYQKFFLTTEELQACRDGYIYVHDMSARRDTMNCFARSTKFWTEDGLKSFEDYEDGDKVRVPSHKGVMRDAVVHRYGRQSMHWVTFGNGSDRASMKLVTPNHRWILEDGSDTTELKVGDRLVKVPNSAVTWLVTDISAEGVVLDAWCLEVEEDHSFILEDGIPCGNCCLFDMKSVMTGGFEMGNIWYNEPKTLDTAFDVMGDVILSAASQQYGGFTVPEVDTILEPFAEKSYQAYKKNYEELGVPAEKAEAAAWRDTKKDMEQGFQGWEYKFNTVGSSRGDYPFITITGGLGTGKFAKMASIAMLDVRRKGQGKKGNKKPVLFPKIVFLYDENLHGPGKPLEDVFEAGIRCSAKTMYPDWLSLTGKGYVAGIYKKYGRVISPMGCVSGQELVTYKFEGRLYVEAFFRMWNRLAGKFETKKQDCGNGNLYMDLQGVEIYDKEKGFVETERIIRNISTNWVRLRLANGRVLLCTRDHPITTKAGVTKHVEDLEKGEELVINNTQYSEKDVDCPLEMAWLYGMLLCGAKVDKDAIRIAIDSDSIDDAGDILMQQFQKCFRLRMWSVKEGNISTFCAYSDDMHDFGYAEQFLLDKFGSKSDITKRHMPDGAFSWPKDAKLAFMAGMIDAEGIIGKTSDGSATVQFDTLSKELALQQMAMAQALGMPAMILEKEHGYRVLFVARNELAPYVEDKRKKSMLWGSSPLDAVDTAEVLDVEPVHLGTYSYDVTTSSGHFDVSSIWSHNCRAFLSPWFERGGMEPADEEDKPVFVGRFNIGAVSLHLPMILAKAREEGKDFYEVLDYYLELIRNLHIRTYAYLGDMRASTNPLAYCEGGFLNGHLGFHDKIKPLLKYATASFGITALNELQILHNGKSLVEDGEFAMQVMQYINDKVKEFKEADGNLYALYGTPAESLCSTQVEQFRRKYGIIKGVSDRPYVSNSFHCHVTEDITPIQKQNLESRFWDMFNGGKIQYVKYPIDYNFEAMKTLVRRAMDMGLYEGVNLSLAYCDDCGHQELEMDVCPKCGSRNLTKIDRMNGYLSYSRVHGDTRLNAGKMAEIAERRSM